MHANSQFESPLRSESDPAQTPVWSPRKVRDLIRECALRREIPRLLIVGREEFRALRDFLAAHYAGESASGTQVRYAGMRVVAVSKPNELRVESRESLYRGSRHSAVAPALVRQAD